MVSRPVALGLLVSYLLLAIGETARLDSYDYSPPKPQSLYVTPSRTTARPVRPPPPSYQTPRKPPPPPPPPPRPYRPPQPTYRPPVRATTPRPTPPPYRPPQREYKPPVPKPSIRKPQKVSPPAKKYPKHEPQEPGMPYDFEWAVEDSNSGNSFKHFERSDGHLTQGEYQVLLPDGRLQIVKFHDDGWGFVADVTYQ